MNAISIGPLVFDGARFAAVLGLLSFFVACGITARMQRGRPAGDVARWAGAAVIAWIVAARIGFVVVNWSEFAPRPLDTFKLWQGGFHPGAGWVAGIAVFLLALLREAKAVLKPLAVGGVAALIAHRAVTAMLPLPDVMLPQEQLVAVDNSEGVQLAGRDRPVVLNLWATWCPPCRREMPMMTELAANTPGVDFVFANQGDSNGQILGFRTREGLPLDGMVRDPQSRLMSALGAFGLPTTMVFDAEGRLVAAQAGEVSRAALTGMIEKAVGGPE